MATPSLAEIDSPPGLVMVSEEVEKREEGRKERVR